MSAYCEYVFFILFKCVSLTGCCCYYWVLFSCRPLKWEQIIFSWMFSLYLRYLPFLFNPIKWLGPDWVLQNTRFSWFLALRREVVSSYLSCLFSQKRRFWISQFSLLRTSWGWNFFIHIFICWCMLQFYWLWRFSLGSFSHLLWISRSVLILNVCKISFFHGATSHLQALGAEAEVAASQAGREVCAGLCLALQQDEDSSTPLWWPAQGRACVWSQGGFINKALKVTCGSSAHFIWGGMITGGSSLLPAACLLRHGCAPSRARQSQLSHFLLKFCSLLKLRGEEKKKAFLVTKVVSVMSTLVWHNMLLERTEMFAEVEVHPWLLVLGPNVRSRNGFACCYHMNSALFLS